MEVVVFPTPPFWFAMLMTFVKGSHLMRARRNRSGSWGASRPADDSPGAGAEASRVIHNVPSVDVFVQRRADILGLVHRPAGP